jgi:hypothetical protein
MPALRSRSPRWFVELFFLLSITIVFGAPPQAGRPVAPESAMTFAAFTDTHVGQQIRSPKWGYADYLDRLAQDVMDAALPCEFVVHLGDGAYDNTAFINGVGLPKTVDPYKSNFKAFLLSHLNLPFHYVGGNIDLVDYSDGPDLPVHDNDPFEQLRTYINETELNHYPYAMMRNGILFLALPEMAYEQWTPPYIYEWVRYMTTRHHDATTVIFSHQAIEDTTPHDGDPASSYRGKQDQEWWSALFRDNPQILFWIHGHNHMPGWYQGDRSSGWSRPVQLFGHEMGFSAPYPQMDWGNFVEEDTIVFYTISASGLTTRAWENNGAGGRWVSGADMTWKVPTSYDPRAEDWYAFPALIQDGETQITDMKVVSSKITLELAGTEPLELFTDPGLETKGSHVNENILGFDDDLDSKVTPRTPGMTVAGPAQLTFPPKHEWDKYCHDGRGGPPYRSFPVGTIVAAAPGGSYTLTMTARSKSGTGRIDVTASCSDWGTKTQSSTLAGSSTKVFSRRFGTSFETVSGTFVIPRDDKAWFLQGILDFVDPTEYDVAYFSVKRTASSETTDDFRLSLSGHSFGVTGPLRRFEARTFIVNPIDLAASDGRITFKASIVGNRTGIAQIVYHAPLLMGRDARYKVNGVQGNTYDLTLTADLSGYSKTFSMFPFSTKYGGVEIRADDGSGENHTSKNGNGWVSCSNAKSGLNVRITYPVRTPALEPGNAKKMD